MTPKYTIKHFVNGLGDDVYALYKTYRCFRWFFGGWLETEKISSFVQDESVLISMVEDYRKMDLCSHLKYVEEREV